MTHTCRPLIILVGALVACLTGACRTPTGPTTATVNQDHASASPVAEVVVTPQPEEAVPDDAPATHANLTDIEAFLTSLGELDVPEPREVAAEPKPPTASPAPKQSPVVDTRPAPVPAEEDRDGGADQPIEPARRDTVTNMQVTLPPVAPTAELAIPVIESATIRSAMPTGSPGSAQKRDARANEPINAVAGPRSMSPATFLSQLEEQAGNNGSFDAYWQWKMAQLALQQDEAAGDMPDELTPGQRRILGAMVSAGIAARRVARDPAPFASAALDEIDKLRLVVSDLAEPVVSTVVLARKVLTFGVYEEMGPSEFVAGRTVHTIVYCEIKNLKAELTSGDQYRTVLGTRLEVMTLGGVPVWHHEEPEIEDLCRRPRTDFFLAQRIVLPPTLPAGDYVLKVSVEDKLAGRVGSTDHRFSLISAPSAATGGP